MKRIILFLFTLCLSLNLSSAAEHLFQIRGRIIDKQTREPVSFANVILETDPTKGSATDEKGDFSITEVKPGIYRLVASCIGYKNCITPEYIVSANTPFVEIEMEAEQTPLDENNSSSGFIPEIGRKSGKSASNRAAGNREKSGSQS